MPFWPWGTGKVRKQNILIAKNYLTEDELKALEAKIKKRKQ